MRILLTGATGYLGTRLARHLRGSGAHVTALGRRESTEVDDNILSDLAPESLPATLAGLTFDAVINLAAAGVHPSDRDPINLIRTNAMLPTALALAVNAKVLLLAGSSAEYAEPEAGALLREDSPLESGRLYGATKAAGSLLALSAGKQAGLNATVLRLFNLYGAGEAPHRLLSALATKLRAGETVPLSPGTQVRDFIYAADAVEGFTRTLEAQLSGRIQGGIYNLCTGRGHSVAEFAKEAAAALGAPESQLQFGAMPMRPDDLPYLVGDPAKLTRMLDWTPPTMLHDGIRAALEGSAA